MSIKCKTCDTGELTKHKRYRMSGVVVLIGYILLIPSVIGMLVGVVGMASTSAAAETSFETIEQEAMTRLTDGGLKQAVADRVARGETLAASQLESLSPEQRSLVESVETSVLASKAGAGVGVGLAGGFSAVALVMSLVGGLLGWLLVMKKKVLQCNSCGAVTAAS